MLFDLLTHFFLLQLPPPAMNPVLVAYGRISVRLHHSLEILELHTARVSEIFYRDPLNANKEPAVYTKSTSYTETVW